MNQVEEEWEHKAGVVSQTVVRGGVLFALGSAVAGKVENGTKKRLLTCAFFHNVMVTSRADLLSSLSKVTFSVGKVSSVTSSVQKSLCQMVSVPQIVTQHFLEIVTARHHLCYHTFAQNFCT